MATRLLPRQGTPEWDIVVERFQKCDAKDIGQLAKELRFANAGSFLRAMRNQGVHKSYAPSAISPLDNLEQEVLNIVSKKPVSVSEISRQIDRSSETVIKILDSLRAKHYAIELDATSRLVDLPKEPQKAFSPTEFKYFHNFYRIGLVADTQLGSKYQQLTALHDAYKIFDERDVDCIFHAGDLVDGVHMYRGHEQELFLHNAEEQRKYTEENYPKSEKKGLKTYVIGGQHDRSFWKDRGYDIIEHICEHRDDLIHRGFFSHQFEFKGLPVRLEHPGGGVAYARSYKPQKIVENMMGFINTVPTAVRPVLIVAGHWHTPLFIPVYMGTNIASMPCFQSQTPFMQQLNNAMPTVGCAIAEIWMNGDNNLSSVKVEFLIMNDRIKERDY